jgi:hypothetical protein
MIDFIATLSRRFDLAFKWPGVRRYSVSLNEARRLFAMYAIGNWAWRRLGPNEILRVTDGLT